MCNNCGECKGNCIETKIIYDILDVKADIIKIMEKMSNIVECILEYERNENGQ